MEYFSCLKKLQRFRTLLSTLVYSLVYMPLPGPPAEKLPPPPIIMFNTQKGMKSGCWWPTLSRPETCLIRLTKVNNLETYHYVAKLGHRCGSERDITQVLLPGHDTPSVLCYRPISLDICNSSFSLPDWSLVNKMPLCRLNKCVMVHANTSHNHSLRSGEFN